MYSKHRKYWVEVNIKTGDTDGVLWTQTIPTDGRPMEFDTYELAELFMDELEGNLEKRVTSRGENLREALAGIEQDYTIAERKGFASTIHSISKRAR